MWNDTEGRVFFFLFKTHLNPQSFELAAQDTGVSAQTISQDPVTLSDTTLSDNQNVAYSTAPSLCEQRQRCQREGGLVVSEELRCADR